MKSLVAVVAAFVVIRALVGGAPLGSEAAESMTQQPLSHPLVGSWASAAFLLTFSADGTTTGTDPAGLSYHGAWQPVDEDRATYELQTLLPDGAGQGFMGPAAVSDEGDAMITNEVTFLRILAPDPSNFNFGTPTAS